MGQKGIPWELLQNDNIKLVFSPQRWFPSSSHTAQLPEEQGVGESPPNQATCTPLAPSTGTTWVLHHEPSSPPSHPGESQALLFQPHVQTQAPCFRELNEEWICPVQVMDWAIQLTPSACLLLYQLRVTVSLTQLPRLPL